MFLPAQFYISSLYITEKVGMMPVSTNLGHVCRGHPNGLAGGPPKKKPAD